MKLPIQTCDRVASKLASASFTGCDPAIGESVPTGAYQRRSLLDELTSQGVRMTVQRRVLVEIIQEATEHLDAAGLLALAREREATIDRATVYRTLELLKKHRLVDELDLMHLQ